MSWQTTLLSIIVNLYILHTLNYQIYSSSPSLFSPLSTAEEEGLSAGAAAGITFIVTLLFTAVVTTAVILVILYFLKNRSSKFTPSSYSSKAAATVDLNGKEDISTTNTKHTTSFAQWGQEDSKPAASMAPSRPVAPPPKPSAPKRPVPPARPSHAPSPHSHPPYNGY